MDDGRPEPRRAPRRGVPRSGAPEGGTRRRAPEGRTRAEGSPQGRDGPATGRTRRVDGRRTGGTGDGRTPHRRSPADAEEGDGPTPRQGQSGGFGPFKSAERPVTGRPDRGVRSARTGAHERGIPDSRGTDRGREVPRGRRPQSGDERERYGRPRRPEERARTRDDRPRHPDDRQGQERRSSTGDRRSAPRSPARDPGDQTVRAVAREAVARGSATKARAGEKKEKSPLRMVRRDLAPVEEPKPTAPARRRRPAPVRRRKTGVVEVTRTPAHPRQARDEARLQEAILRAARALERGYERDAVRILRPMRDVHPESPDVRELLGLALYRLGRWAQAQKELDAFVNLTGSAEQHPVLMDIARALGRHARVEELWEELRAASPGAEVMTEGRIVTAGSLADRGRVPEAIKLLERGPVSPKRVGEHHLRLWYALADLQERAGDLPAARSLFRRVSSKDPSFVDVAERLAALS